MSIWRWSDRLNAPPVACRITRGEGETPLVRSLRIGPAAGIDNLWFKLESCNPSGSYKDRFAAAAVSDMLARGKQRCIATSSGNTGSALAAYCAAAGITCEIAIVETAPLEKLQQMLAHGARLYRVRGFGSSAGVTGYVMEVLRKKGSEGDAALQISAFRYSAAGMAGVKTIAYELAERADASLEHVFVPAGGGGLTLAVARGFNELPGRPGPRVECVQPEGNDTIATPLRQQADRAREVHCTTRIGGLQVPSVIDGDEVIAACRRCGGTGHVVSDDEVWSAQRRLALEEGIFCEPAGAVALAGALAAVASGEIRTDAALCCLVTGTGFKDAPAIQRMLGDGTCPLVEPEDVEHI
jgi:threonine synthase